MHHESATQSLQDGMLERGVYRAPYLVEGYGVLIAVDSHGVARKHIKLMGDVSEETATTWLRGWLDQKDPLPQRPQLALVKDDPPQAKIDLRNALDTFTEERMRRNPQYRARVNRYLAELAGTPIART